jgi:hypothetical protein
MSRACYTDDCDSEYPLALRRGAVMSSIRGKRGQAMLRELLTALDAMPQKRLIAAELEKDGEVCALGALGRAQGKDMHSIDPEDYVVAAREFNIAEPLAREIEYENDEGFWGVIEETPEARWERMRAWVAQHLTEVKAS